MKKYALLISVLCGMLLPLATQASTDSATPLKLRDLDLPLRSRTLPSTNEVERYERYSRFLGEWTVVSKTDGDTVLACLHDRNKFEDCQEEKSQGQFAIRCIRVDGGTNSFLFSTHGETHFISSGGSFLIALALPDEQRKTLSQLFNTWREADARQLTLPRQYSACTVKCGDSLSNIAQLFYGDAAKWPVIYEANKAVIKDPDVIACGTTITIPKLEPTPP